MHLAHLSLTNFRLFHRLDVEIPPRFLLLTGANAQGKTSLLEAIYFLATFTSFQAQHDRQLINFLALREDLPVTRLLADFHQGGHSRRLEVRIILENNGNGGARLRKEILLDGVRRPAHDAVGQFAAVIFLPQMARVVEGAPEERRRYMNLAISQAFPGYARLLGEYQQVLTQRNALLKQIAESGRGRDQLDYWDELLADKGAQLMYARIKAVEELERIVTGIHLRLTRGKEELRLMYMPAYDPQAQRAGQYALPIHTTVVRRAMGQDEIRKGFIERLQALRNEEILRGVSTIGPHRDDLRFLANQVDLGDFGSRGQIRTLLLALKVAEAAWLKECKGEFPVVLLDEILAELDIQRRNDLLYALSECEQVLCTSTDPSMFSPDFVEQCTVWQVVGGQVSSL
ncbi:MAG: DNA replication and repair protein RecF [Anaerolineae bacterium]|nr:DNA replication and repair protein RecF [Anaerolineae bacterium]